MLRGKRSGGALIIVIATTLMVSVGSSGAVADPDFPTWDDVQNARANESATAATIAEIEGLLATLETQSAELGKIAQQKGEEYNVARDALSAAVAKADRLAAQALAASDRAEESTQRAGHLVAQLARTGGGDVTLGLVFSPDAGDLLSQLATLNKLGEQATMIYRQAVVDENLAQSLTDQARVAEKKRTALKDNAEKALAEAEAAAQAARDNVARQQAAADQMYAQLAALKGTTAGVEQGYSDGVAWEAAQNAIKNPPPPAPPVNPPPPPPSGSLVDTALDYAYAQIGDMYQFGGSGPDAWDCSGLTKASYAAAGVNIGSHSVSSQYNTMANQGRLVPLNEMARGDLLFYADGGGFYHVAIYVGGGQMIEAPREGVPVRVTSVRYGEIKPYAGRPTP